MCILHPWIGDGAAVFSSIDIVEAFQNWRKTSGSMTNFAKAILEHEDNYYVLKRLRTRHDDDDDFGGDDKEHNNQTCSGHHCADDINDDCSDVVDDMTTHTQRTIQKHINRDLFTMWQTDKTDHCAASTSLSSVFSNTTIWVDGDKPTGPGRVPYDRNLAVEFMCFEQI